MRIGRFEILEKLGEGAMGTVYRALDPLIERTVAIKTIPLNQPEEEKRLFEDRFLREAKSAGKLSHPNIVTIYDVGETDDFAYIAMEYLEGMPLREILREHGPLPIELGLETALQMAQALAFAHEHGIVHRDIKPPNVIVCKRGTVKLTDFGIAHLMSSTETRSGMLMGSPRYMSPEQVQGQPIDGRSDIFSLGVVLYEMLAGYPPFGGEELHGILFRIVNEHVPPVSHVRKDAPAGVDEILARCLAKKPQDRYSSAHELAIELGALLRPSQKDAAAPIANPALPRSLKALAFGMPVLIALALAIGIIVTTFIVEKNQPAQTVPSIKTPQLINITTSLTKDKDAEKSANQSRPANGPAKAASPAKATSQNDKDFFLEELDKKLAKLKVKRTELLSTYTELHPDVIMLDRQIEQMEDEKRNYIRRKKHQNN
jgi:serine/threonine-protein kinase